MPGLRTGVLSAPPVWQQLQAAPESLPALLARNFTGLFAATGDYLEKHAEALLLFALIAGGLFALALQLRRMGRLAGASAGVPGIALRRPFLVLAMLWLLLGLRLLLPEVDPGLDLLRACLVMSILAALLPEFVAREAVAPLRGLLAVTFMVMAERALLNDALYGRLLSMLLAAGGIWLLRRLHTALLLPSAQSATADAGADIPRLLRVVTLGVTRYAPPILAVGILAEVLGAESYGNQLVSGALYLTTALVACIAADMLVKDVLVQTVHSPVANWLRAVRNHPEQVVRYSLLVFRVLLVIGFVAFLPVALPMLAPLWAVIGRAVAAPLALGSIGLSFGDLIAFVVSVVLAVNAARLMRFLLQEDVVSRLPVSATTASAVTRLAYYGIMVAGVLFAFAAAGLELSQLTMVVSALGVGIGFGLQDVVRNFVSGLVIAFEHPFREGDLIATGQITGRLQEIGLRTSRIRTVDGAEVMVPNATLTSTDVTNWTLSDRTRRIEIIIGVDYDSDPRRVIEVLRESVVGQPGLLSRPAPLVLFRNFAASALEFSVSVWTADIDDRLEVESEARLRIFSALRAAGIGIPFPQLDLHVLDVPPGTPAAKPSGPQSPPPVAG
ncbi:MAG: mechanosensitive ion channel [Gammaproteobacteria bacterium]|nr:mechanosensitive ion channel [Gammaproteobacteria bacterium]